MSMSEFGTSQLPLKRGVNAAEGKQMKAQRALGEPTRLRTLRNAMRFKPRPAKLAALVFDLVLDNVVRPFHQSLFWGDRLLTLDKTAGFLAEPAFRAALAQADSSTGANQYQSPNGIAWRYHTLIWAARSCLALPGDFVECGVYRGDMTWMIAQTVDLKSAGKRFYLYDTFAGMAPNYSSAGDFPEDPQYFRFIDKEYRAPDIEGRVRRRFQDEDFIIVTKGIVPDILHQIAPGQIAFLHLDMNSPRAEAGALEVLFDRISPGGIIVFDDYGWKLYQKQKEAADSFMAARGQVILELPTGQGLTIKR
jgi:O-methyltransferase